MRAVFADCGQAALECAGCFLTYGLTKCEVSVLVSAALYSRRVPPKDAFSGLLLPKFTVPPISLPEGCSNVPL